MAPASSISYHLPHVQRLLVNQLRNVGHAEIRPGSNINVIYGDNAAGKTSILEALYMLSTARSFRTRKSNILINHESPSFSVFAEFKDDHSQLKRSVGIERKRSREQTVKLDKEPVRSSSELAESLAMIAIEPKSFDFIEGGPSERRALLDWLLFHVKHDFLSVLKDYQNCLKQRNILLRRDKISRLDLQHWDLLLCQRASAIDAERSKLVEKLAQCFDDETMHESLGYKASLRFSNGWGLSEQEISEADDPVALRLGKLKQVFDRDAQQGYSTIGSHRFDLSVRVDDKQASELLSRGQKKQFVIALYLEVARIFGLSKTRHPIFLLDDLPSELDSRKLDDLLGKLIALDTQIFISCIDKEQLEKLPSIRNKAEQVSWFHVKHGEVTDSSI